MQITGANAGSLAGGSAEMAPVGGQPLNTVDSGLASSVAASDVASDPIWNEVMQGPDAEQETAATADVMHPHEKLSGVCFCRFAGLSFAKINSQAHTAMLACEISAPSMHVT